VRFRSQRGRPGASLTRSLRLLREVRRARCSWHWSPRFAAHTLRTLLGAYLGPKNRGPRAGPAKVERGDVQEIEAAIWFSRSAWFSRLWAAGPSRRPRLIAWLNDYFAAVGRAIGRPRRGRFSSSSATRSWRFGPVVADPDILAKATCRAGLWRLREGGQFSSLDRAQRRNDTRRGSPRCSTVSACTLAAPQYGNIGGRRSARLHRHRAKP